MSLKPVLCRPYTAEVNTARGLSKVKANQGAQPRDQVVIEAIEAIAKKHGVTMAQIAIAWSLKHTTAPIIGVNSVERLDDLIKGLEIKLSEEEVKEINAGYQVQKISGHT